MHGWAAWARRLALQHDPSRDTGRLRLPPGLRTRTMLKAPAVLTTEQRRMDTIIMPARR